MIHGRIMFSTYYRIPFLSKIRELYLYLPLLDGETEPSLLAGLILLLLFIPPILSSEEEDDEPSDGGAVDVALLLLREENEVDAENKLKFNA